jgi:hypothetical protein
MVGPPIIGSVIGNLVGEKVGEKTTKNVGLDKAAGQVQLTFYIQTDDKKKFKNVN